MVSRPQSHGTHREIPCPSCAKLLNGWGDPRGGPRPKAGDLTICAGCSEVLRFCAPMPSFRHVPRDDLSADELAQVEHARSVMADFLSGDLKLRSERGAP